MDGTPLIASDWWISEGSLAPNHVLEVSVEGQITDPGNTKNVFTCNIIDITTGDLVSSNYAITMIYGRLEVTSK